MSLVSTNKPAPSPPRQRRECRQSQHFAARWLRESTAGRQSESQATANWCLVPRPASDLFVCYSADPKSLTYCAERAAVFRERPAVYTQALPPAGIGQEARERLLVCREANQNLGHRLELELAGQEPFSSLT